MLVLPRKARLCENTLIRRFTEEQQRKGVVEYNYWRGRHAMDATPVPEPVAQFAAICGTARASGPAFHH